MTIQKIKQKIIEEYCFNEDTQKWWMDKVDSYPKNDWFRPNDKSQDFTCCRDLHSLGLCDMMLENLWSGNGDSYKGKAISFRFTVTFT